MARAKDLTAYSMTFYGLFLQRRKGVGPSTSLRWYMPITPESIKAFPLLPPVWASTLHTSRSYPGRRGGAIRWRSQQISAGTSRAPSNGTWQQYQGPPTKDAQLHPGQLVFIWNRQMAGPNMIQTTGFPLPTKL